MKMPAKIKFGILGSSKVAAKNVIPALLDSERAALLMIGSRTAEKGREIALSKGVPSYGSYADVLANEEIDVVYVSLPNTLHEEWTIKALEAGKHVICEKPAALTYASAKRMVAAAKKNNRRLMEGLMFRHHPQHQKVLKLIDSGELGELVRFDACFSFPMPDISDNLRNKELGGGTLNYMGPYPIAACRMIFGEEPENVFCRMAEDPETGVDSRADITLGFPNGKAAFSSTIFGGYFQSTYAVLGSKAGVRMGRAYAIPKNMGTTIFIDRNDKTEELNIEPEDHFKIMLDSFCEELTAGEIPAKNHENDLLSQARILEAARLSAAENRVVSLAEIV